MRHHGRVGGLDRLFPGLSLGIKRADLSLIRQKNYPYLIKPRGNGARTLSADAGPKISEQGVTGAGELFNRDGPVTLFPCWAQFQGSPRLKATEAVRYWCNKSAAKVREKAVTSACSKGSAENEIRTKNICRRDAEGAGKSRKAIRGTYGLPLVSTPVFLRDSRVTASVVISRLSADRVACSSKALPDPRSSLTKE